MGMRSRPQQLEGSDPPTAPVLWAQAEGFPLSPEFGRSGGGPSSSNTNTLHALQARPSLGTRLDVPLLS